MSDKPEEAKAAAAAAPSGSDPSSQTPSPPTRSKASNPPSPSGSSTAVPAATASAAAGSTKPGWPNNAAGYEVREVIGVGATAQVHAAFCTVREEKCAIKRINLEKWNTSMDELHKEIQAMSSCSHENVVTYFTSFVHEEELWLILRLLDSGSLLDIIRHKMKTSDCKNGVLDEVTIATVLRDVLKGLEYLHNTGHIHRDIKAGNILLGTDGQVQIADFGVSAWLVTGQGDMNRAKSRHTFVGTPCWMAPEVMEQVTGYDYKADIWSFGITAIELATGTAPYHKYPPMKVLMLTLQNDPPTIDSSAEDKEQFKQFGRTFRKMISECLQKDPSKRPTATELLKHPFFKNKAKDKKFLQSTLVASSPNLDARLAKAKSGGGAGGKRAAAAAGQQGNSSGRLHRNPAGDWVFDFDDDDDDDDDTDSSSKVSSVDPVPSDPPTTATTVPKSINMVLRMRNTRSELNDIRFEYQPTKDTAEGIASELLGTGLITDRDLGPMADNLRQLVENPPPSKTVTFRVTTGIEEGKVPDEKNLNGFAQLNLVD